MTFKDKTIWITGASSGIGEALAYAFAERDANLVLSGRNKEALEKVKSNCAFGSEILVQVLDLEKLDSFEEIVRKATQKMKKIDVLINNAGITQRALAKDTQFEVDKKIITINLLGTIALTKAVLPQMLQRKQGHLVVISSLMGKFASPLRSSYAASKHGLHGFFDALRAETFRDNIKITLICPGFIRTQISMNALKGDGSKQNSMDDSTASGMAPEKLAGKIIRAIEKEKKEITVGGFEILAVYLKRFFPGILSRIIRKVKVT